MLDIAIKVENISKRYQIGESAAYLTLRDKLATLPSLIFKGPKKSKEFWALREVSFTIKRGEVVGIIGRNGAGKSTLLKILARITEPTSGQITMYGRVASMLEVGTGFNQELTGRENIYLNGSIIGMTSKEIKQKFAAIVEFAGVEKFLDTPVKHYSSGMYVRLAFAVAAHLDADILLVDEVLAVGDAEFQKKCLGKISDIAQSGRTVIFVSHSISNIKNLCNRCLCLEKGKVLYHGKTDTVIAQYSRSIAAKKSSLVNQYYAANNQAFKLKLPYWVDNSGQRVNDYDFGQSLKLRFELEFSKPQTGLCFGISLVTQYGEKLFFSHSVDDQTNNLPPTLSGKVIIDTSIDLPWLSAGSYRLPFGIKDAVGNPLLFVENDLSIEINQPQKVIDGRGGILEYTGQWRYKQ